MGTVRHFTKILPGQGEMLAVFAAAAGPLAPEQRKEAMAASGCSD
jgi:hypothetical protein